MFPNTSLPLTRAGRSRASALLASLALAMALLLSGAWSAAAHAAAPGTPAEIEADLASARKQIDDMRKRIANEADDANLQQLYGTAVDIQAKADAAAETLAPQLASVAARLNELGAPPEGSKEAPDVAAQRLSLETSRRGLDAQIKLAKLLSVDAGQTAEQVSAQLRTQFKARLGERRDAFLSGQFWNEFKGEIPRDLERLSALRDDLYEAVQQTPAWGWLLLAGIAALVIALRMWIGRALLRLTANRVPPGRLRRSALAAAQVALSTATPGLIAVLVHVGLDWNSQLSDSTSNLLAAMVITVFFGGYTSGLGSALLSARHPSWRLPPIGDAVAQKLSWVPATMGALIVLIWLAERLTVLLNTSLTTTITLTGIVSTLIMATMAIALAIGRKLRRQARKQEDAAIPAWVPALTGIAWAVLIVSLGSLLAGYVAIANFLAKQVLWVLIVLASGYLASTLIEDVFSSLLSSPRPETGEKARPTLRDQAAVLLSGVGRVAVGLLTITLLLAPFGEGPTDLLQRFDQLRKGLAIGEAQIHPGAVLQALIVLALALLGVKMLKRWLSNRYLPTTELDPGMQLSAVTLFGYAGFVVAVALALSAAGIGLERVAWIASALSVGIGFGLQAIVQNFVSGLILLAERPVQVGDWVSLGGVEGDILRINVRATEIQMSDRSTVIVPNSEFITKTVRNVTRSSPLGLVQIKLPMPLSTDAERARDAILQAFADHPDILATPTPNVFLDGVDGGNLIFNAKGYVSSPRAAYGVRSALLFSVLGRLRAAGLEVSSPTTLLLAPTPPARTPDAPGLAAPPATS